MKPINTMTADCVRSRLRYDPETGKFFWLHNFENANLDARFTGKEAGRITVSGYRVIKIEGRAFHSSRLAWLYVHGRWPSDRIDHINGIRTDNRINNLRECTHAENCRNRKAIGRGMKGVQKQCKRWAARIKLDGKLIHLGTFDTEIEAHEAYCVAARKHFGEFWRAA